LYKRIHHNDRQRGDHGHRHPDAFARDRDPLGALRQLLGIGHHAGGLELVEDFDQNRLQRLELRLVGIHIGVIPGVPVADGQEQADRGEHRHAQRHDDAEERLQVVRAVDFGGFLDLAGDLLHEGAHQNHQEHADQAGEDIDPEGVDQPQGFDDHIRRDETAAKIHREHKEEGEVFPPEQITLAERIGKQCDEEDGCRRPDDGTKHGDLNGAPNLRIPEDGQVALDRWHSRPEVQIAPHRIGRIVQGDDQDVPERIEGHEKDAGQEQV